MCNASLRRCVRLFSRELSQEVHLTLIQPGSHQQAMNSHRLKANDGQREPGGSPQCVQSLTQDIMLQKYTSVIMLRHC